MRLSGADGLIPNFQFISTQKYPIKHKDESDGNFLQQPKCFCWDEKIFLLKKFNFYNSIFISFKDSNIAFHGLSISSSSVTFLDGTSTGRKGLSKYSFFKTYFVRLILRGTGIPKDDFYTYNFVNIIWEFFLFYVVYRSAAQTNSDFSNFSDFFGKIGVNFRNLIYFGKKIKDFFCTCSRKSIFF